jgi:hypothetical protein
MSQSKEGMCRRREGLSTKQRERIEYDASQMLNQYNEAVNKGGLLAELPYLDTSAEFFWVPPNYTAALSFDSVASILKANAPRLKAITRIWESLDVFPLTKDLASYHAIQHVKTEMSNGDRDESRIIESGLLIKRKDGWKLLSGHTSAIK